MAPLVSTKGAINPPSWNTFFLASSDPLPPTIGVLCCSDTAIGHLCFSIHILPFLLRCRPCQSVAQKFTDHSWFVCLRSVGSVFSLLNTHWKLPYREYNICSAPSPNLPQACIILDKKSEWAYTRYKISSHLWLKLFITFHYSLKSIPIHLPATVRLWTTSPTSFSSTYHLCSLWGGNLPKAVT